MSVHVCVWTVMYVDVQCDDMWLGAKMCCVCLCMYVCVWTIMYVDVQCGNMWLGAKVCCVCVSVCVYIWMYVCRFSVGGYR